MLVTLSGIVIVFKAVAWNAWPPMLVTLLPRVTNSKFLHRNANFVSILVISSPMVTALILATESPKYVATNPSVKSMPTRGVSRVREDMSVHPAKAVSLILFSPLPRLTDSKRVHPCNTILLSVVTPSGIAIVFKGVPLKASRPMLVTLSGIVIVFRAVEWNDEAPMVMTPTPRVTDSKPLHP